jgi:hypothetical protein
MCARVMVGIGRKPPAPQHLRPFVIERLRALQAAPECGDRRARAAIWLDKTLGSDQIR